MGFHLENANVSNEMKKVLKKWNDGAHREVANCVKLFSSCPADVRDVEANDAFVFKQLPDAEEAIDGSATLHEDRKVSSAAYDPSLLSCCYSVVLVAYVFFSFS